jgi:hypothetical protein
VNTARVFAEGREANPCSKACVWGWLAAITAAELVTEKVKGLSEAQAEIVLAYVEEISGSPRLSASDLMRLPAARRRAILDAQAAKAAALYRQDPKLVCEDAEAPLPYGCGKLVSSRCSFDSSRAPVADKFLVSLLSSGNRRSKQP